MYANELRRMLEAGLMSPQDLQPNELAMLVGEMPQPRYDIPKMQENTMRFESGPEAGRVVNMDFPQQSAQNAPQRLGAAVDVVGKGKGRYSPDGRSVVFADGSTQDLHPEASMQSFLDNFKREKATQDLAQGELGMEQARERITASQESRDPNSPMNRARAEAAAQVPAKPTTGQDAVDREFAKEYVQYRAAGGFADTQKQLIALKDVYKQLGEGRNLTGTIVGNSPDWALAMQNPQALAARDAVEEVVQRNLRLILGAQFTQKEGERLIARAYNPRLGELENQKRLGRLITQIETAAKAKQDASDYFEVNGSLRGWKGSLPTWNSFDPDNDMPGGTQQGGPQGTQFDSLPDPGSFSGKRMQGPDGIYKSDGSRWIKQ